MATDPSNLLALIASGGSNPYSSLVRDNQNIQQGGQQLQQGQQQLAVGALQLSALQQQQKQAQQYQQDVQNYFADPKPGMLANLIAKYPQQAAALKESKAALDEPQRQSQLTQFGQVYNAASSGRTDLLLKQITNIQQAEQTAGIDTSEVDDLIGQLQSKDPAAVKAAHNSAIAFSQAHLAALDPKFEEALSKGHEGYTLSQGQTRFDANGNPMASVAPKPDYLVVPEGGKAIPLNGAPALDTGGGGQASGSGGGAPNSTAGSPRYTGGWTPRARNGGDNTDAQVDNKIAGAAKALGVDPDADIRSLSPAQIAQAMTFGEGGAGTLAGRNANPTNMRNADGSYKKFNSPQAGLTAAASLVARKLQRGQTTVRSMIEGLPVAGGRSAPVAAPGGPQPGDPAGTVYGTPKPGYHVLAPGEVPPGLDPNTIYQRSPTGEISPVGGQKQGQLKPWPAPALQARVTNDAALKNITGALSLLNPNNNTAEAKAAKGAVGLGTGMLGDRFTNWSDPGGADYRARIGQIGGIIIKDTSGAAVSLSEDERLSKWVPKVTDSPGTIRSKLNNLRRELSQRNEVMDQTYSEDQGFRPLHSQAHAPAAGAPAGFKILRVRPK